jgi:hypothetical protein
MDDVMHYSTSAAADASAALAGVLAESAQTFTQSAAGLDRFSARNVLAEITAATAGAPARFAKGATDTAMPTTTFLPLRL